MTERPEKIRPEKIRCDACPVMCYIAGACDRYAVEGGRIVRVDPLIILERTVEEGGDLVLLLEGVWDGKPVQHPGRFVTGIGAGTTYPDYKPAPFIVSRQVAGAGLVTVVSEGIFSYCGVKVKIDTDRHLGPEGATVRAEGEPVGHVTTAEYGSQMLAAGQIEGGVAQGIGMALIEEYVAGRSENLHEYLIPTTGDVPPIETILIEKPDPEGPFGAKGLGEHALIPTAPAILAAIRHATGARITRLPALPHRILDAMAQSAPGRPR